jgi:hypothetical protein
MTDFVETFTLENLAALRQLQMDGPAEQNTHISDGIYLSWDDESTTVTLSVSSDPSSCLSVTSRVEGDPRWMTLNLELGRGVIESGDVFGLVVEGEASEDVALPLFLRSKVGDQLIDSHWSELLALKPGNGIAVAFHTMSPDQGVCGTDGFHTLVLSLPKSGGTVTLRDLRLFRMPASRGLRSTPETLSSWA